VSPAPRRPPEKAIESVAKGWLAEMMINAHTPQCRACGSSVKKAMSGAAKRMHKPARTEDMLREMRATW